VRLILRWIVGILATILAVYIGHALLPRDIAFPNGTAPLGPLIVFAIVLGLLNAFVRPILALLTLPLTILTLGLFSFVISALIFYLAAALTGSVIVTVLGALVGAIIVGLVYAILEAAL
jgi:putative membrane protein